MEAHELSMSFHMNWFKAIAIEQQPSTFIGFSSDEENDCNSGKKESVGKRLAEDLIIAVDLDLDGHIDFAEYLLLRKAAVAWSHCAQETMNKTGLRCALALTVSGRHVEQSEADTAFRVGLRLMPHDTFTLSFPIFVIISDLFRTFTAFDVAVDNGFITKAELTRRLAEMEMPHRISP